MILACVYRLMDALGKFGEHSSCASSNSSILLCSPNFPCASIIQYMHTEHETIVNYKAGALKQPPSKFGLLHSQNYVTGIRGHYHKSSDCFEYPQKSLLKSSYPKKYLAKFSYPVKSRNRKIQPPPPQKKTKQNKTKQKSFDHPCHLNSGVPPTGLR